MLLPPLCRVAGQVITVNPQQRHFAANQLTDCGNLQISVGWLNLYGGYKDCLKCMIIKVKPTNKAEIKVTVKFIPHENFSLLLLLPPLLAVVQAQHASYHREQ